MQYPTIPQVESADLDQLLEYWRELPYAQTPDETRIKNRIYDRMRIKCADETEREKRYWIAYDAEQRKKRKEVAACP